VLSPRYNLLESIHVMANITDADVGVRDGAVPRADVCCLAESFINSSICGHSIPLNEWTDITATNSASKDHYCPLCHHPVTYIADGVASDFVVWTSRNGINGENKSLSITNQRKPQLVYFKYGKLIYLVSVQKHDQGDMVLSQQSFVARWSSQSLFSFIPKSNTTTTAQQRIASVLGIAVQNLKVC
jgi:hypothetical protein